MPCVAQGGNEALHDGPLAAVTLGGKFLIVVLPTVCLPVLLVESLISKMLATQRAKEMLRMPCFTQSIHATLEEINRTVMKHNKQNLYTVGLKRVVYFDIRIFFNFQTNSPNILLHMIVVK